MKSLKPNTLGIIGFGPQAKAWALNYKDSGHNVVIVLRENSQSATKVAELGFQVRFFSDTMLSEIETFVLLAPDDTHLEIVQSLKELVSEQATFFYAHGYSYACHQLATKFPQFNHILLAPKAIASEVRFRYTTGENIMAAYSLEAVKDDQWDFSRLKTFANNLGFKVLIEATFDEETKADLFSEQSLLCSLIPYGALHSYNKLREKGVNEKLAFIECWMEVLLIAKAMIDHGPTGLFDLISPNALIGGEKAVRTLFDDNFDAKLDKIMDDVWDGSFYKDVAETDFPKLKEDVLNFWKKQEIQAVYDQLKKDL